MKRKQHEVASVDPDINRVITPMLDLAFQILLFFIMTYHPSQLEEGQMDLSLPDAAQTQAESPKDANPLPSTTGELELPSEVTVFVKTQHSEQSPGDISLITVQDKVKKHDEEKTPGFFKYLERLRPGLSNQNDIKIQADSGLKYSHVMEIMDLCTRAGFKNISFGPPADKAGG
jgi:biopolymer transport protein ExbD